MIDVNRWVSLLVAEIFYPDIYFPVNQIMPMLYKQQQQQQQQGSTTFSKPLSQNAQQQQTLNNNGKRPLFTTGSNSIISTASAMNANQLNGLDLNALTNLLTKRINNDPTILINHLGSANNNQHHQNNIHSHHHHHPGLHNLELLARKARLQQNMNENELNNNDEDNNNNNNNNNGDLMENSSTTSNNSDKSKHCDGYDKIGCYVVRVYYDWFLVNGSCKCWKSSSGSSINETIKRIFIGKWKKK